MSPQITTSEPEDIKEDERPEVAEDAERIAILDGLAKKVEDLFQKRANQRAVKDGEWDTCLKLYHAPLIDGDNYYSEKPFDSKPSNKRPVPNIVRTKCDTAIANSVSMQFAGDEKNWDLFPPANNTDDAIAQACKRMEREIQTQLDACNYALECRRAMEDRVVLGAGIMKGPVNTGKMRTKYVKQGSSWIPTVVNDFQPTVVSVRPWRFYPDMDVVDFKDSLDAIEYHPKTAFELSQLRNHPGFDRQSIDYILSPDTNLKPSGYNVERLPLLNASVWSSPYMYKERYAVLEYHGPVTYDEACKLGLDPTYESPTKEYYGEIWVCCGKVIRMELENIEAQYETPYSVAVWKRDPTSVFGFGLPLLLADAQRVTTQAYHMILDNASLTSGPQVSMYQQWIEPVDGDYTLRPNKAWLLKDPSIRITDAINFFTPTNVIGNIMPVLELARGFANEESAATETAAGLASPQNVDSATGQLILASQSTTILDFLAEEWDDQVTEKIIRRFYAWNMQYNPKEDIKGDYVVDVKSSSEYKNKQMHIRDLERLQMETAQNPALAGWIKQDALAKARLHLMKIPDRNMVRTDQEYAQWQAEQAQQPNPQAMEMQLKMADAQRADRELQLKEAQLQFELQQAQQRELWEHEEKQGSNYARVQEAQAQVIKARSEVETEMIKLAAKDRQLMLKMQQDAQGKQNAIDAQVFMEQQRLNARMVEKQLDAETKQVDQLLTAEELVMKRDTGTGI